MLQELNKILVISADNIISAIVNVDQDVNEPWPLYIWDLKGETHQVLMEPGDVVWFEGMK